MHKSLEAVCAALDELSVAVTNAWSGDQTLCEAWGWNCPTVTRHELAEIPKRLATRIREASPIEIEAGLLAQLNDLPRRLKHMQAQTLPYLFNGNAAQAAPAYIGTMALIQQTLEPLVSWQLLQDPKAMPAQIARRLRSLQAEMGQIVPDMQKLGEQIELIQEATAAAESLPTDLQALAEARKKIDQIASQSSELYGKIDERSSEAHRWTEYIERRKEAADKLVGQCEDAYRITTTKGLAAAFDQRASRLAVSMWAWVVGLLVALGFGAFLGSHRVELLSSAISNPDPQWGVIGMHIALSILSVGAPLWFAWLATKQIGQRFRLAEDYAFKASVAKAYEGYRKEAARLDEAFEARLFSSALSRLEEAPLRLVEHTVHGSPWHELISSDAFRSAMDTVPELKDKFVELAKAGISTLGRRNASGAASQENAQPSSPPDAPQAARR